jgi:ABC-type transport system involved in multi-copper enzyme maturation permease subunit
MMGGSILAFELRVAARRAKSYRQRASLAIALALAIGLSFVVVRRASGAELSVQQTALFAQYVFAAVAGIQVMLTVGLVPALLAGAISQERERRTLDGLLTTRLSSNQIVLGKFLGGLLQYAACLLSTLPVAILLSLLGGVDPRLVLLVHAGTASVAFFMAGMSILVSTSERSAVRAVNKTIGFASAWFLFPVLLRELLPRVWPLGWSWIRPWNAWILASSPNSVAEAVMRFGVGTALIDSIIWMIGLQLAIACAFVIWSIARLRRSSRLQAEGERARSEVSPLLWRLRRRLFRRPSCGLDPVLWKEIHTARVPGISERLAWLVALGLVGLIAWGTYHFGQPAFIEQYWMNDVMPHPHFRRFRFNLFLSHVSSWVEFFLLLIVAGVAGGSVTGERARDTWDSLIATPLSGREILRAKMLATAWKVRPGVLLLLCLWAIGSGAGSLHPIGFGAAVVILGVSIWFMTALGTYVSLISRDSAQASNRALIPALLLSGSFLVCYLPSRYTTVFMGVGSAPFVNWLCLASNAEIRDVMSGAPTFGRLEQTNIPSYESASRVLAAYLFSVAAFAAAAACLSRAAFKRFDRVAGRPEQANELRLTRSGFALRTWWRKRPLLSSILIAIALSCTLSVWFGGGAKSLREALAETDALCPGWRLDHLEAARTRLPDAKNGALRVIGAAQLLPSTWRNAGNEASEAQRKQLGSFASLSPVRRLPPAYRESMRARIEQAGPALAEAIGLAELPAGRYPVSWARDGISTRLPHLAEIRDVASLLLAQAILESETGRADRSFEACRALLNVGRSIGDEPALVSQRLRMELRENVCRQVERSLAHGRPSDSLLESMQRELEAEEREPLLVFGIRGERAIVDRFLSAVDAGEFTYAQLESAGFAFSDVSLWKNDELRAAQLRFDNRAEQIASFPAEEQLTAFERLLDDSRKLPYASRMLAPAVLRIASFCLKSRARLRCAAAGLACERYRNSAGIWPDSIGDLVPHFSSTRPIDPFDGKPLRFRRADDHIVIYSVGEDRRDDGGQTEAVPRTSAGADLEFRLWNPSSRHQAPPPG